MMRSLLIVITLFFTMIGCGSIVEEDIFTGGKLPTATGRVITWEGNVGVDGGIPNRTTIYTTIETATQGNDTFAINNALSNCPGGQVVKLGTGTFTISGTLNMKSNCTLRGDGAGVTILNNIANGVFGIIRFGSGFTNASSATISNVSSGYTQGSTSVTLANASAFSPGDFVYFDEFNDTSIPVEATDASYYGIFPGSSTRVFAVIHEITGKAGNVITIDPPAVYTFPSHLSPRAILAQPTYTQYAGVEDMTVKNDNTVSDDQSSQVIIFQGAAHSWVKGVRLERCGKRCIDLYLDVFRNTVTGNYMTGCIQRTTSDRCYAVHVMMGSFNLIENNVYDGTGEGNMTSTAVGNVFAYNYSYDVRRTGYGQDGWFYASDWTHGAHSAFNLYEGNISQGIKWDNIHGSGSHNTSFRNRYTGKSSLGGGIGTQAVGAIITERNNNYINEIGNILGTSGWSNVYEYQNDNPPVGTYPIHVVGVGNDYPAVFGTMLRHMNYDYYTNSVKYCDSSGEPGCQGESYSRTSLPASLYLSSKPAFFACRPWPGIGPDLNPMVGSLPAEDRFKNVNPC